MEINLKQHYYDLIICDIDGTISADYWRRQYLPPSEGKTVRELAFMSNREFDDYHYRCNEDKVLSEGLLEFIKENEGNVRFLTNRRKKYKYKTWLFFRRLGDKCQAVPSLQCIPTYMRKKEDHRPSFLFKLDGVYKIITKYARIAVSSEYPRMAVLAEIYDLKILYIDDDSDVVETVRDLYGVDAVTNTEFDKLWVAHRLKAREV